MEYMTSSHNRRSVANQWSCIKEDIPFTQVTTAGHLATEAKGQGFISRGISSDCLPLKPELPAVLGQAPGLELGMGRVARRGLGREVVSQVP